MRRPVSVLLLSLVVAIGSVAGVTFAVSTASTDTQPASVTFEDQTSDGTTVDVGSVHLPDGGFVAVYCTECGLRGASEYLEPGAHEDVSIEIDSIEQDRTLVAVVYRDTNGNQAFDENEDVPYRVNGERVSDRAAIDIVESENETNATDDREENRSVDDGTETDETVTIRNETGNVTIENATILRAIFINTTIEQLTIENSTVLVVSPEEDLQNVTDDEDLNVTDGDETNATDDEEEANATDGNASDEAAEDAGTSFTVSSFEVTDVDDENETMTVQAVVDNPSDEQTTQDVDLRVNGDVVQTLSLTLDANESAIARFTVDTENLQEGPQIIGIYTDQDGANALVRLSDSSDGNQIDE